MDWDVVENNLSNCCPIGDVEPSKTDNSGPIPVIVPFMSNAKCVGIRLDNVSRVIVSRRVVSARRRRERW